MSSRKLEFLIVFLRKIFPFIIGLVVVHVLSAQQQSKKENSAAKDLASTNEKTGESVKKTPSAITGDEVLARIDKNLHVDHAISLTKMVIHGRSRPNVITAKTWVRGKSDAFSEYLSPTFMACCHL